MNIQQQPTNLGACHEIDETTGRPAIAFVGEKPWHGLGQELTAGASIETWTKEAGLNFEVKRAPVEFLNKVEGPGGVMHERIVVPNRDVLYRSDTLAPLGIMSKGYKIVQPADVMNFFGELAAKGGFTIETAGALRGGAKIWALAKVGEDARILDRDIVQPYLLLATSFDGSLSTIGKFTAVRVVCRNTINVAIANERNAGKKNGVRIPHHSIFDPANVRDQLGIALNSWEEWLRGTKDMAERAMDGQGADSFLLDLLRKPKVADEDVRESTTYRTVMALFEGKAIGSELTGGRTEWQMLNSVTEFVDHMRGNSRDARLNAAWFGAGDALKSSAYELLSA